MLHISAITTVIRQSLYKNIPRKVNNNGKRDISLTSIAVLPCVLSLLNVVKYCDYHEINTYLLSCNYIFIKLLFSFNDVVKNY